MTFARPCLSLLALAVVSGGASGATDDAALDLTPQQQPTSASSTSPLRALVELAVGRMDRRFGEGSTDVRRASLDLTLDLKPGTGWRAVLSNRLDDIHPVEPGGRSTLNSLREGYVGWQPDDSRQSVEVGRVNARHGPAYGFNPTDYFREGAVRAVTSPDPLALRENRLGTVMVRGQWLLDRGSVALALAPKLRDHPSQDAFSPDFGATNHSDRALLSLSARATDRISGQAFAFHERGRGWQFGVNGTALLGNAVVAFAEGSTGRDVDLLNEALEQAPRTTRASRAVAGLTYTTPLKLSVTAEYQYNGFALNRSGWDRAASSVGVASMGRYLYEAQRRQDIASRRALMLYATQADAFVKGLDVTALARVNLEDRSRFSWVEARYHFPKLDVAVQWQTSQGKDASEFGSASGRRILQVLTAFYF